MMKDEEKIISGQRFSAERALYAARGVRLEGCRFEGEEDGESALKESRLILAQDCFFDLRYPLWHAKEVRLFSCTMTENCRAALWYDEDVFLENCKLHGIKAVRECTNVRIDGGEVVSPEFGWRSRGIFLHSTAVTSEYAFFGSRNIVADGLQFSGKYCLFWRSGREMPAAQGAGAPKGRPPRRGPTPPAAFFRGCPLFGALPLLR